MKSILLVGIGGFIGSISRYYSQLFFNNLFDIQFPLGTFFANVIGSFLIGVVFGLSIREGIVSEPWRLLISVGFCGGFTTFSSFSLENINLIQSGNYLTAGIYIFTSLIVGLAATFAAIALFR